MDINTILNVIQVCVLPVLGVAGYFIKRILSKIDEMEKEMETFISAAEARQLIDDKQEALIARIKNVEYLLNRILNELQKKH